MESAKSHKSEYQVGDQVCCWFAPQYKGHIVKIDRDNRITMYYVSFRKPYPKNQFGHGMMGVAFFGWQIKKVRGRPVRE